MAKRAMAQNAMCVFVYVCAYVYVCVCVCVLEQEKPDSRRSRRRERFPPRAELRAALLSEIMTDVFVEGGSDE